MLQVLKCASINAKGKHKTRRRVGNIRSIIDEAFLP